MPTNYSIDESLCGDSSRVRIAERGHEGVWWSFRVGGMLNGKIVDRLNESAFIHVTEQLETIAMQASTTATFANTKEAIE